MFLSAQSGTSLKRCRSEFPKYQFQPTIFFIFSKQRNYSLWEASSPSKKSKQT